jgi:DME family drug/metabolite transporter
VRISTVARPQPGTGLFYLVTSGLLWGTGGLTGSVLSRVTGLSALSVAACRLTVGGGLIVILLTVTRRRWPVGRAAWTRITVIGLLAALYQGCYFTAVSLTSVPLATLVTIGSAPVIVQAVDGLTGRGADRRTAGATCLALAGLGLLVGLPSGPGAAAVLSGAGLAVLAAAGFAAVTLIGAKGSRPGSGLDELTVTGFGFTVGGLALTPLAVLTGGTGLRVGPEAIGLLLALGTGPTAVAYTLYFRGLRTAAASTAALLTLLEPLTGTVLALLVLGQRLNGAGVAGAAILSAAVAVTVWANRARPAVPVPARRSVPPSSAGPDPARVPMPARRRVARPAAGAAARRLAPPARFARKNPPTRARKPTWPGTPGP